MNPERLVIVGAIFIFLFIIINVNASMGNLFMFFFVAAGLMYLYDVVAGNGIQIKIESKPNERLLTAIYAVGAFVLLMITNIVFKWAGLTDINSSLNMYAQYIPYFAEVAILSSNAWFVVLGWGILIPLGETLTFGRIFEAGLDFINERVGITFKAILIVIGLSFAFALFHIAAKGIQNNLALLMTFIFMVISLILILIRKQLLDAILFHIIANTTSIVNNLKLSVMNPYIIAAIIGAIFYLIISRFKILTDLPRRFGI